MAIFKKGDIVYPSEFSNVRGKIQEVWNEGRTEMAKVKASKGLSGTYLSVSLGRPVKK